MCSASSSASGRPARITYGCASAGTTSAASTPATPRANHPWIRTAFAPCAPPHHDAAPSKANISARALCGHRVPGRSSFQWPPDCAAPPWEKDDLEHPGGKRTTGCTISETPVEVTGMATQTRYGFGTKVDLAYPDAVARTIDL